MLFFAPSAAFSSSHLLSCSWIPLTIRSLHRPIGSYTSSKLRGSLLKSTTTRSGTNHSMTGLWQCTKSIKPYHQNLWSFLTISPGLTDHQLPTQQTSWETSHSVAAHHYQLGEMYIDWNMKGDRLVSTANHSHNHYLCVWDVNEGKLLVRLFGHKSFITSVLWISDHRIASSSKDHTIKVWEVIENA